MREFGLIVFLSIASWMSGDVYAQSNQSINGNSDFRIYVMPDRYGDIGVNHFRGDRFVGASLLTRSNIDPRKEGKVDEPTLTRYIEKTFPDKNKYGVCLIDWEEPFREIKKHYKNASIYKPIEEEYIKVIRIIRKLRPNVEVSIYGIPFVSFSRRSPVLDVNKNGFFDNLLSHCDVITPSIYLRYADEEVGQARNIKYLQENLDVAMEYGQRLNKKVVPYFWYRIHPMNKDYGLKTLSEKAMSAYMQSLMSYSYKGKKLGGIIWYEGNIPHTLKIDAPALKKELEHRDNTISKYLGSF